jgi:hypothetical protein
VTETGQQAGGGLPSAELMVRTRALAERYSLAVDSRDLSLVSSLFSEQARFGSAGSGSAGARAFFAQAWSAFRRSIHVISNHVVTEVTPSPEGGALTARASGVAYCDAEQEALDGTWSRLRFAYFDSYVNEDGAWFFMRRRLQGWYVEPLDTSRRAFGPLTVPGSAGCLPEAWPSWAEYWRGRAPGA